MASPNHQASTTPSEALLASVAPDDAGAETADRYEWQAMMAAADMMALYFRCLSANGAFNDDTTISMICEFHEDWAVVDGNYAELISAKHREASVARLATLGSLLDCGVHHLFCRWIALKQLPMCRLVTTAGIAGDALKIHQACEALRATPASIDLTLEPLLKSLAAAIAAKAKDGAAPETDQVARFLRALKIQHSEPRRDHLPDMAATRYGNPVADRLGRPEAAAAMWAAVLGLARERMRACGPSVGGALPTVLGIPLDDDPRAARTLTLADIDTAVRVALRNLAGYSPLPRRTRTTRVAVKLMHGGCSDNTIERIDGLRLQQRAYWRSLGGTPSLQDRRRRLNNLLLKIVSEATEDVRTNEKLWGLDLLSEVERELETVAATPEAKGLDSDLLLGAIADLANDCKVWFTDAFDIDSEILRLREAS